MKSVIYKHQIKDCVLLYVEENGVISLITVPKDRENLIDLTENYVLDGMIQLSLLGDVRFTHYSSGQTMRNSSTTNSFRLKGQKVKEENGKKIIETLFVNPQKLTVKNIIIFDTKKDYFKTYNILKNNGTEDITVEMFAAFSLSGIAPFGGKNDQMKLHRLRGNWSAEGRPQCDKAESVGLEQSWTDYGLRIEKFGSVGSMPIQRYFPFACIEDCKNNVYWGVTMEAPYSWQMEVCRHNKYFAIGGGTADFEYGHYRKTVKKGQSLSTNSAYVAVSTSGIEDIYDRLRGSLNLEPENESERGLPIIYNEYCNSWGGPTHEEIISAAKYAKKCGAEYFVIDAGWYSDSPEKWSEDVGDFDENKAAFPYSMKTTAEMLRNIGLTPGIWFEMECVASNAKTFGKEELFLKRDGKRIYAGNRSFLDFRKRVVKTHLRKKVIDFLKDNGFGYVKIDYNECIGIGCDGDESYGSALAAQIEGVLDFIEEMKKAIPGLVIESCASGGHRIEPKFLSVTDMTSFSDAHEVYEGAVVAANVNRLCPTRKNQIWAVVDGGYSLAQIRFSIAKAFFGRLCLSGDISSLSAEQFSLVKAFTDLYKKVTYILKDDRNTYFGETDLKYRDLVGEQAVLKIAADRSGVLIIVHGFANASPITVKKDGLSQYRIEDTVAPPTAEIKREGDSVTVSVGDFDACVIHLVKG